MWTLKNCIKSIKYLPNFVTKISNVYYLIIIKLEGDRCQFIYYKIYYYNPAVIGTHSDSLRVVYRNGTIGFYDNMCFYFSFFCVDNFSRTVALVIAVVEWKGVKSLVRGSCSTFGDWKTGHRMYYTCMWTISRVSTRLCKNDIINERAMVFDKSRSSAMVYQYGFPLPPPIPIHM